MNHSIQAHLRGLSVLLIVLSVAVLGGPHAWAQSAQRTRISFQVPAENTKYTQQYTMNIADLPAHTIRLIEIHRTFPKDPPVFAGVLVKDQWSRGVSDTVGGNGSVVTYYVFDLENGDKIFGKYEGTSQATAGQSSERRTLVGNVVLTGGTGKLRGIRGVLQVLTDTDLSTGSNNNKYEGEYWMDEK